MKINLEVITSRNNPLVKWAASLSDKKAREESKSFIAEGDKLTYEALSAGVPVTHILILDSKKDYYIQKLNSIASADVYRDTVVTLLSESAFSKISTEKSPQGIISIIKYLDFFKYMDIIYKEEFVLEGDERALALCSVRDPLNLGSVIRSAVAFGVEHLVLTSDCADVYNPKTVRCAMGSLFKVKITYVGDFSSFIRSAREVGRRVFSAELTDSAASLLDTPLLPTDILMIGNEGHGISSELSAITDKSVYIPISDKTESLNASVAAAIFMWEQEKTMKK